jgi:spermidine/putrescine transport system permease protein
VAVTPASASSLKPGWRGLIVTRRNQLVALAQLTPALVIVGAFVIAPLAIFAFYSFWRLRDYDLVSEWNLENYREVLTSPIYRDLVWNTIKIAGMASLATVAIAYAFAHAIRFHLRRFQEPLLFLIIVACFSGYLVRIYAWRTILGEEGIINRVLQLVGVIGQPLGFLLFNRLAAVIVLTNFLLPFAVLAIYASLQDIRESEIEAARDLGAGAFTAFRRVTLPLAWPGIFAAFAISFILAAGDYLTPQLVGGTSGSMIGRVIANTFTTSFNWPRGAALSFVLLAVVLALLALVRAVGGRALR